MSDFSIEDIIELLQHTNYSIVNQVIDVVISSEDCLRDARVANKLTSLLSVGDCTEKAATALAFGISEYGINIIEKSLLHEIMYLALPIALVTTKPQVKNILFGLLSNIVADEDNALELLNHPKVCEDFDQTSDDTKVEKPPSSYYLNKAIALFVQHNPQIEENQDGTKGEGEEGMPLDATQHIGHFVCNLCRLEKARKTLTKQSNNFLPSLIQQIRSTNSTRRSGAVNIVRCLLFDKSMHWHFVVELNLMKTLLYNIVVATPITEKEKEGMDSLFWMRADLLVADKARKEQEHQETEVVTNKIEEYSTLPLPETNIEIATRIFECVLILCQTRIIRDELKKIKIYPILRNFDIEMGNDDVNTVMADIVNFLQREESNEDEESVNESAHVSSEKLKLMNC